MPPKIDILDARDVQARLARGEIDLVDVREENEWAAGRIPGARLQPLSRFDPEAAKPAPGKLLVLHCRSGVRCGKAAEQMLAAGYAAPFGRLAGGILAWAEAGLPVDTGKASS
ncbi:MAG: rhodanese-like domain-containing protein [Alphaproteobacteria bacterium]|nr:rhodanese-like domain-containing protein [Alphaproteobacteria bacterium]